MTPHDPADHSARPCIAHLLAQRQRLDQVLRDQFARQVAVMFTDIQGSTRFFETYGDIEGRLMIERHNALVFPCIQSHDGRIVKTIGDAVMAAFSAPDQAVRAAMEMQRTLAAHNRDVRATDHIHIRIGINCGEGLVDADDIFGDVVNVAARIESLAAGDDILLSDTVYDQLPPDLRSGCRFDRRVAVTGKQSPMDVYRAVWRDFGGPTDAVAASTRARQTTSSALRRAPGARPARIMVLTVAAALIAGLVLALIYGIPGRRPPATPPRITADDAWRSVQAGQLTEARLRFESLPETDARRYEGLAAVQYRQHNPMQALDLAQQALTIAPDAAYPAIIQGHVLPDRENLAAAAEAYQRAAERADSDWQKAEALNSLGRIHAARGEPDRALGLYARAAAVAPRNAVIMVNRAMALQTAGKRQRAITYLQAAGSVAPDDPLPPLLLRHYNRSPAQLTELRQRAAMLAAHLRAGTHPPSAPESSTPPVSLVLLPMEHSGAPAPRDGENQAFLITIQECLQQNRRLRLCDLMLAEQLRQAAGLDTAECLQPPTSARLGRLLGARLAATGITTRLDGRLHAELRLIDTRTATLQGIIIEQGHDPLAMARTIAEAVSNRIARLYPLQATVTHIGDGTIELNIGSRQGVRPKMRFGLPDAPGPALAVVTTLAPEHCRAAISRPAQRVTVGSRLIELTDPP